VSLPSHSMSRRETKALLSACHCGRKWSSWLFVLEVVSPADLVAAQRFIGHMVDL